MSLSRAFIKQYITKIINITETCCKSICIGETYINENRFSPLIGGSNSKFAFANYC